jgi:hypothetical protein
LLESRRAVAPIREGAVFQHMSEWWTNRKRREALSDVRGERQALEDTLDRAEMNGISSPPAAATYLAQLAALEGQISTVARHELDDIRDKAESLGELRAYFYPPREIDDDGHLAIDRMTEWDVPLETVASVRARLGPKLKSADVAEARAALNALFAECDSWAHYSNDYETMTRRTAWALLVVIAVTLFAAFVLMRYPWLVLLGLLSAAIAGSCASVITKIGPLAVTSEFEASLRRIPIRIGTGIAASVIGSGLLCWGFAPIAFQSKTYFDLLLGCATPGQGCPAPSILGLTAVSALLGFSERVLTWLNERVPTSR